MKIEIESTDNTEKLQYDIVIIGAGPSGLAAAIKLKQLANINNLDLSICILEKGAYIGAHIISGAVFEADSLSELISDWQDNNKYPDCPIKLKVAQDKFYFLTKNNKIFLPIPKTLKNTNKNNYIISLSNLCKFLANIAEGLNIDIFPGFPAEKLLINSDDINKPYIYGVKTKSIGIDKNNNKTSQYQPGVEIHSKQIILAEGARGSLTKKTIKLFSLDKNSCPQTYGLGIKEIWQIDKEYYTKNNHNYYKPGLVEHSIGWPLDKNTYGGSFIYHLEDYKISYGFITGLDYKNPYLSPFEESQRFKTHPKIKHIFKNSTRISYGARALCEGGIQSLPKLSFPGGIIIGDSAGFLNVAKLKGSHNAIKSGIIAAESIINYFIKNNNLYNQSNNNYIELENYQDNIKNSSIYKELYKIRNIRPSFKYNLYFGLAYAALDNYILMGHAPWTLKHNIDYKSLVCPLGQLGNLDKKYGKINYPKPDNTITFDRSSSVYLSNTFHNEDQIVHLKINNKLKNIQINYNIYHGPEQYYCPAGVYEYLKDSDNKTYLQINAANCVHCKTCDIKDPAQEINWEPPEGGSGPNYVDM